MYQEKDKSSSRIKMIAALVVTFVVIVISVSVAFMIMDNHVTVVIRNLDDYMSSISNKDKKVLHGGFGDFIKEKVGSVPSDIYIRDGSYFSIKTDDFDTASFIVDIDSLKASYKVSFAYPSEEYTSINPVIDCPSLSDMKYPETECVGMYSTTDLMKEEQANPIQSILPIMVDEFDDNSGVATRYDIFGFFDSENENKFNVSIVDYSCNNRENALQMIRNKGFNPDDYTIDYKDECYMNHLPYTSENSLGDSFRITVTTTEEGKKYFLIDNYACYDKSASEASTMNAVKDWFLLRNLNIDKYEYGILTLCNTL